MKAALRLVGFCLAGLALLVLCAAALLFYFVYSPDPPLPALSGTLSAGTMTSGGLTRTYQTYLPKNLAPGAALVLVLHGSGEDGARIRTATGYGFERLADQHGFAVVYPDSASFDWNDCSMVGDFKVNGAAVDDVAFLAALAEKVVKQTGSDPRRVFATGVSAGGFMSLRLALESPARFRAVAAVAANLPVPANFRCKPAGQGSSVMIMNGTSDPLVPFEGGEVNLLGLFYKGGEVRSSRATAQYFADLYRIGGASKATRPLETKDVFVEQVAWRDGSPLEVELVAIHGGGHGLPQPHWRRPRLLGPSPMAPDGPAMIWAFFNRQQAR